MADMEVRKRGGDCLMNRQVTLRLCPALLVVCQTGLEPQNLTASRE